MRRLAILVPLVLSLAASPAVSRSQAANAPGCTLIQRALDDISGIRVGMKRGDLEKRFKITHQDAFRNQAVYAYKRCPMIKVRATFSMDPNQDSSRTSTDIITTMSQLFLSRDPND
ncbi:MAG TPA: hypothetical protein VM554_10460 [Acidisarcina sp.]|nr:hypothetical protein [Acidisarcina sp.]